MIMNSEIDYSKLTTSELKILISVDDLNALKELNRRIQLGEIQSKIYTIDEVREIIAENIKAKLNSELDYTKLTVRELKHLMSSDPKADREFDRRVSIGEIKLRTVTLEQIREEYAAAENKYKRT